MIQTFDRYRRGNKQTVEVRRKRMQQIRAATDERTFYASRAPNFEKLKSSREGQYSMRLNDQWRLIVELKGEAPRKTVHVVEIADYRPVSVAIKGVSAGGKSFTVEQVLKFFPAPAYFVRTGMSERAIIYSDENYRHRFIVIFEAVGMNSDIMSYLIRTLLSEGRVVYEVVEKTKLGLRPRRIEKEGPTGLITTTTAPKLHPENETRLLSLGVIDTPHQTKAVMKASAPPTMPPRRVRRSITPNGTPCRLGSPTASVR
jgi:plasmid maintenance system killer protein